MGAYGRLFVRTADLRRIPRIRSITLAFLLLLSHAVPNASVGQASQPRYRIGVLTDAFETTPFLRIPGVGRILEPLGYTEGKNIAIERRFARSSNDQLPELAAGLVASRVDLIAAIGMGATRAARKATRTIPIVMLVEDDPVAAGLVKALAEPGGNVTGIVKRTAQLNVKRLQLLSEVVPGLERVGVFWNPGNPEKAAEWKTLQTSAQALGLELELLALGADTELEPVFDAGIKAGCGALLVTIDRAAHQNARTIGELAIAHRLPTIFPSAEYVNLAIGLMSYGPSGLDLSIQFGTYIDKVLKGASPSTLPIEQPQRFELYLSNIVARAIGVQFPPSLLLRADQVRE